MRRIISLLLVLYLCLYVSGQNRDGVKYVFPFHPGSVEWKKLGTDSARILALQMPQNVLQKMPTETTQPSVTRRTTARYGAERPTTSGKTTTFCRLHGT